MMIQRPHPVRGPVEISIELCAPTARAYDLDNRVKALLDLLVAHAKIDGDDNHTVKRLVVAQGMGFTGARITVTPLAEAS